MSQHLHPHHRLGVNQLQRFHHLGSAFLVLFEMGGLEVALVGVFSGLRRGHRQHRSLDTGLVHEDDVLLHVPARDGEPLVHIGTVGLDVVKVTLRDSVAVEVDLRHDW